MDFRGTVGQWVRLKIAVQIVGVGKIQGRRETIFGVYGQAIQTTFGSLERVAPSSTQTALGGTPKCQVNRVASGVYGGLIPVTYG